MIVLVDSVADAFITDQLRLLKPVSEKLGGSSSLASHPTAELVPLNCEKKNQMQLLQFLLEKKQHKSLCIVPQQSFLG